MFRRPRYVEDKTEFGRDRPGTAVEPGPGGSNTRASGPAAAGIESPRRIIDR